jgi:hypothetical protein
MLAQLLMLLVVTTAPAHRTGRLPEAPAVFQPPEVLMNRGSSALVTSNSTYNSLVPIDNGGAALLLYNLFLDPPTKGKRGALGFAMRMDWKSDDSTDGDARDGGRVWPSCRPYTYTAVAWETTCAVPAGECFMACFSSYFLPLCQSN